MSSSTDIFVFGDQSTAVLDKLQKLLHVKDNAILRSFLSEAFLAIRHETESLPSRDKESVAQAESLGLLLEAARTSTGHAALDSSFLCIYEIGYYIE